MAQESQGSISFGGGKFSLLSDGGGFVTTAANEAAEQRHVDAGQRGARPELAGAARRRHHFTARGRLRRRRRLDHGVGAGELGGRQGGGAVVVGREVGVVEHLAVGRVQPAPQNLGRNVAGVVGARLQQRLRDGLAERRDAVGRLRRVAVRRVVEAVGRHAQPREGGWRRRRIVNLRRLLLAHAAVLQHHAVRRHGVRAGRRHHVHVTCRLKFTNYFIDFLNMAVVFSVLN